MKELVNKIIEFKYKGNLYYALVEAVTEDGTLFCYRVVAKMKTSKKYIPILDTNGGHTGFQVQYGCRFALSNTIFKRVVFECKPDMLEITVKKHRELPTLSSLQIEREELCKKINLLPTAEKKRALNRCNELTVLINDRTTNFLEETPRSKIYNKYKAYSKIPDKKGIRKVYGGGKVSPK